MADGPTYRVTNVWIELVKYWRDGKLSQDEFMRLTGPTPPPDRQARNAEVAAVVKRLRDIDDIADML